MPEAATVIREVCPGIVVDLKLREFIEMLVTRVEGIVYSCIGVRRKIILFKSNNKTDVYDPKTGG